MDQLAFSNVERTDVTEQISERLQQRTLTLGPRAPLTGDDQGPDGGVGFDANRLGEDAPFDAIDRARK